MGKYLIGNFKGPKGETGNSVTSVKVTSADNEGGASLIDDGITTATFEITNSKGEKVVDYPVSIKNGSKGSQGEAATIEGVTVQMGETGTDPKVENVGTKTAAKFNFTIPKAATVIPLTRAEYDALPESQKNADVLYDITDEKPDILSIDDEAVSSETLWSSAKVSEMIGEGGSGFFDLYAEDGYLMLAVSENPSIDVVNDDGYLKVEF